MPFWSYGQNPMLSMMYLHRLTPMSRCTIQSTQLHSSTLGDIPWQCHVTAAFEEVNENSPAWMQKSYEVWYRDPDAVVTSMLLVTRSIKDSLENFTRHPCCGRATTIR